MNLREDDQQAVYDFIRQAEAGPVSIAQASIGYGAGGPVYLDIQKSKRAPAPSELVNQFKSIAYACATINAHAVSAVPLRLYGKTSGRDKPIRNDTRGVPRGRLAYIRRSTGGISAGDKIEEVLDHPLLQVLDDPQADHDLFDGNLLIQHVVYSCDIVGAQHWFPVRTDPTHAPIEIWPLMSQYVQAVKGSTAIIDHYQFFGQAFRPEELVRFRFLSLRDPYLSGYSPLHASFEQAGLGEYYTAVVEAMLTNGARPSMIVGPKDKLSQFGDVERKRLEADINGRFGAGRQGHAWVTDGSIEVHTLSFPPSDLGGETINQSARLTVANCFGVPVAMIDASNSNKAVSQEATHQHQSGAVAPRCRMIESVLTKMARRIEPRLFFKFDDPVARDTSAEAKVFDIYLKVDVVTPNEVREELGMEPVEGGDEMIGTKKAAQQAEAAEQAAKLKGESPAKQPKDEGDD